MEGIPGLEPAGAVAQRSSCLARDEQRSLCLSIVLHARKLGASDPAVR